MHKYKYHCFANRVLSKPLDYCDLFCIRNIAIITYAKYVAIPQNSDYGLSEKKVAINPTFNRKRYRISRKI